jgi:ABC-type branched-subunit amino acid transport system ATPase component
MALLAVDAVEKRFGGLPAVDGVTFGVDEGEILAVVGPNGAGKSTLLKTIGGLERPSAGTVTLAGERVDGMAPHRVRQRGIAMVMQTPLTFGSMTVLESRRRSGARGRRWPSSTSKAAPTGPSPASTSTSSGSWRWQRRWPAGRGCCWLTR